MAKPNYQFEKRKKEIEKQKKKEEKKQRKLEKTAVQDSSDSNGNGESDESD